MHVVRVSCLAVALVAQYSCARTVSPAWDATAGTDATASADVFSRDASDVMAIDSGGFCRNPNSARMAVNGVVAESPAPSAALLFLDCCDAAVIRVISARFLDAISLMWRHQVGQGPELPVTLDLANLPPGWGVSVFDGCDPAQAGCRPVDMYSTGLTGTLSIARDASGRMQMSTCLDATESAAEPHPVLHSLQLWVPSVETM